jgi:hypothetical protein
VRAFVWQLGRCFTVCGWSKWSLVLVRIFLNRALGCTPIIVVGETLSGGGETLSAALSGIFQNTSRSHNFARLCRPGHRKLRRTISQSRHQGTSLRLSSVQQAPCFVANKRTVACVICWRLILKRQLSRDDGSGTTPCSATLKIRRSMTRAQETAGYFLTVFMLGVRSSVAPGVLPGY